MKRFEKPHFLLLPAMLLFFVAGFFYGEPSYDFHIRDSYVVATSIYFAWLPAIFILFNWLLYLLTYRLLFSKRLAWIHVTGTIVLLLLLAVVSGIFISVENLAGMPRRYYDYNTWLKMQTFPGDFDLQNPIIKARLCLLLLVFALQLVYVVNLAVGVAKRILLSITYCAFLPLLAFSETQFF